MRRLICKTLIVAAATAALPLQAVAQQFPSKPITIVVPFPPGGGTDNVARFVGKRLHELLGQPVVIENRTGAGGVVGTKSVAAAAADGHTLLVATPGPNAINATLMPNLGYDVEKDFAPVSMLLTTPLLLCSGSDKVTDVRQLLALGRQGGATSNIAGAGTGSPSHLLTTLLNLSADTRFAYVPYRGSAQAALAMLAGDVPIAMLAGPDAIAHVRSGKARPLVNIATQRSERFPEVPLASEIGLKDLDTDIWYGLVAPGKTPKPEIDKLNQAIVTILQEPATKAHFAELVAAPRPTTPQEFADVIRADTAKYGRVIKAAGIKVE